MDVVPADSPGMEFANPKPLDGNLVGVMQQFSHMPDSISQYSFGWHGSDLVVRATRDKLVYELIPPVKLIGDLPTYLTSDYHHWMDLTSGIIKFRPLKAPCRPDAKHWHLQFSQTTQDTYCVKVNETRHYLLDLNCAYVKALVEQLAAIESSAYVHTTLALPQKRVIAELPRLGLTFFVTDDGLLESCDFPHHVIDSFQSVGTLIGLQNQLVLTDKSQIDSMQSMLQPQMVLVPDGTVSISGHEDHPIIMIDNGEERKVLYHQYKLDRHLSCLTSSYGLTSRLFKVYLHAVTSHCLADPLISRTGTEEAFHELSEPATSSFDQLTERQAQMLKMIGMLTPDRSYYPVHINAMQTVRWHGSLSPLAQLSLFSTLANTILERARALHLFTPSQINIDQFLLKRNPVLSSRAASRSQLFYPAEVSMISSTAPVQVHCPDILYTECRSWADEVPVLARAAIWASGSAHGRGSQSLIGRIDLVAQAEAWVRVGGLSETLRLTYSSEWLSIDLAQSWLSLYDRCRQAVISENRYRLGICLATAVYSGRMSRNMVTLMLAFATIDDFRHEDMAPPSHAEYLLSDGYKPTHRRIHDCASGAEISIGDSPSRHIVKARDETENQWHERQTRHFESHNTSLKQELVKILLSCWPQRPSVSPARFHEWFDLHACLVQVQEYFDSCARNCTLRSHLRQVEAALELHLNVKTKIVSPSEETVSARCLIPESTKRDHSLENSVPIRLHALLHICEAPSIDARPLSLSLDPQNSAVHCHNTDSLKKLSQEFRTSNQFLRRKYGDDLELNRMSLSSQVQSVPLSECPSVPALAQYCESQYIRVNRHLQALQRALCPSSPVDRVLQKSGIWPRLMPRQILGVLDFSSRDKAPPSWRDAIVKYARDMLEYQRAQRLIKLKCQADSQSDYEALRKELENVPIDETDYDWLLVQVCKVTDLFDQIRSFSQDHRELWCSTSAARSSSGNALPQF